MTTTTRILGQKYEETESITVPVKRFKDAIGAKCIDCDYYFIHMLKRRFKRVHEEDTGHTMTLFGVKTGEVDG